MALPTAADKLFSYLGKKNGGSAKSEAVLLLIPFWLGDRYNYTPPLR